MALSFIVLEKKVKWTRWLLIWFFKYHQQKYQNVSPRTKAEFFRLWLVAACSCPTAILNWLWVDWNHTSRVTFIAFLLVSLHWDLRFSRSHCKRFLSFRPWSTRGDHTKKSRHEFECEESHSACNNTLSSTDKGMCCFSFFFLLFFFPCYCVFINMLETLVIYPERDSNSLRLQVIKEYVIGFRLRGEKIPHLC